ncbi:MAG: hypothetical protein MJ211_14350 [Bacteroidales bacterium]|nr:hypothetical protein [Bacteroidales bacterium]
MILRDDDYITILMDYEKSLFVTRWKSESANIEKEEDVKEIIHDISIKLSENKPKYYIANQKYKEIAYSVDLQKWVAEELYRGCIEGAVEYAVTVESENIAVSISNDQMIDEADTTTGLKLATFHDEEEAMKWMKVSLE